MRRHFEFGSFVVVAAVLHVALAASGREIGGEAGGQGGDAFVTLQGSNAQIEQVLAEWTKTPEHQHEMVTDIDPPELETADTPPLPTLQIESAPRAQVQIAAMAPLDLPKPPVFDTATAPPPPEPPKPEVPAQTPKVQPPADPTPPPAKDNPKPSETAKASDRTTAASAGVAAQTSAGSGGTQNAGQSGNTSAIGKGKEKKLLAVWGSKIQSRIERNKSMPRGFRGKGTARLLIQVAPTGQLLSVKITRSSGNPEIDKAGLSAVKRSGRFAKAPKGLDESSYRFSFNFSMSR